MGFTLVRGRAYVRKMRVYVGKWDVFTLVMGRIYVRKRALDGITLAHRELGDLQRGSGGSAARRNDNTKTGQSQTGGWEIRYTADDDWARGEEALDRKRVMEGKRDDRWPPQDRDEEYKQKEEADDREREGDSFRCFTWNRRRTVRRTRAQ